MPTLTRSIGFASTDISVLPFSKLSSIAIMQAADGKRRITLQKPTLQASPIGGLEISWKDVKELTVDRKSNLSNWLNKVVAYHDVHAGNDSYKFIVNEPEIWIHRDMVKDTELWISLMLEAVISGIGIHRKDLLVRLNDLSRNTFSNKLLQAYKMHNCRIDGMYAELMKKDKQFLLALAEDMMVKPHELLGLKLSHVNRLTQDEIKQFQRCRPFWATDIDSLEGILQSPPSSIFAVYRGIGTSWVSTTNVCWKAAENLGYVIPEMNAPALQTSLVEVKLPDSSDVKDGVDKLIAA